MNKSLDTTFVKIDCFLSNCKHRKYSSLLWYGQKSRMVSASLFFILFLSLPNIIWCPKYNKCAPEGGVYSVRKRKFELDFE